MPNIKQIYVGTNLVRPSYTQWTPTSSTIGYWELNGNSNDTKNDYGVTTYTSTDYDANGYVGAGNPTYTSGRHGKQCAVFDGTRALQIGTNLPIPSNTVTISLWVNYTSTSATAAPTGAAVFSLKSDQTNSGSTASWAYSCRINPTTELKPMLVQTSNSTGQSGQVGVEFTGTSLSIGAWHNIVFTFNAGVAKYYLDGAWQETKTNTSKKRLRNAGSTVSYIGCWAEPINNYSSMEYAYITGKIQDVIYENKVWTDQEVADYYATY